MRPLPHRAAPFLLFALLAPLPLGAQPRYTVTDLGALAGDSHFSDAYGINNHGDVVGYVAVGDDFRRRPILWDFEDGTSRVTVHDLGTFGQHEATAASINDVGQIAVGTGIFPHTGESTGPGYLYDRRNGATVQLATLGGRFGVPSEINASGQMSGSSITSNAPDRRYAAVRFDLFGRQITDLGHLGGAFAAGTGINDAGHVVGYSHTPKFRGQHPVYRGFLHRNGQLIDLGAIAGDYSVAYDVNNRGQVVGMTNVDPDNPQRWHAFVWEDGVMRDLGSLMANSYAMAINDHGDVVGRMSNFLQNDFHAFVHTGGKLYDLNDLVDLPDTWTLREVHHINNLGQIVGYAEISPAPGIATTTAVLLTPVPEPSALAPLACLSSALLWRRRRHRHHAGS